MVKRFVIALFVASLALPVNGARSLEVGLCLFDVPEHVKNGNYNFYLIYTFKVTSKGGLMDIQKIRNDYISEDQVVSCLRKWRFEGFDEGTSISMSMFWRHAVGWEFLAIASQDFKQRIRLSGERAPYRQGKEAASDTNP